MMTARLCAYYLGGILLAVLMTAQIAIADDNLRESQCAGSCPQGDVPCLNMCMKTGNAVPTVQTTVTRSRAVPKASPSTNPSCPGPCPPGDTACQAACNAAFTSSTDNSSCTQKLYSLIQACQNQVDSAEGSCDEKNDQGMSSVSSQAAAVTLAMGQQSAASVQAACSGMAGLTQAANAALAAYRLNCSSSIKDCKSSCADAVNFYKSANGCAITGMGIPDPSAMTKAQDLYGRCTNLTAKIDEAKQAIANYGQISANATQCANQTSADNNVIAAACAANPALPGCSNKNVDCTDPSMASNKVCLCSRNPSDPQCVNTSSLTNGMDNKISSTDMSSRDLGAQNVANDMAGDIPDLPGISQGALPKDGGEAAADGKQGNGVAFGKGNSDGMGGGSGKPGAGAAGAAATDKNGQAVNSGFYGGGSGSGGWGSGSSDGRGDKERQGSGLWNKVSGAFKKNGPDLRQFLPGGRLDPHRGVAGASGPDGITGPHSNIWQKIQNRYQVLSPSLMP